MNNVKWQADDRTIEAIVGGLALAILVSRLLGDSRIDQLIGGRLGSLLLLGLLLHLALVGGRVASGLYGNQEGLQVWRHFLDTPMFHFGFWGGIVVAALVVAVVGVLVEMVLLRRIYHAPELFQLLATFGLTLMVQDIVVLIWGPDDLLGRRAPGFRGAVEFFGQNIPSYDLFLIAVGPVVRVSVDGFHRPREARYRRGRSSPQGFWLDSYDHGALRRWLLGPWRAGAGRYRAAVHDVATDASLDLPEEQVPGEEYPHGQRIRVYVTSVSRGLKGPSITVSRTHPSLVRRLFALEVPEIASGVVEITALAREAGHRTKIAVRATEPGVNAKGACIGELGQRVRAVTAELGAEKIDIVDHSDDLATFVKNALSPAKVTDAFVIDPATKAVRALVPDYQLSLAIGKEGQNARLAAKLTGARIDIQPDSVMEE